MKRAVVSCFLVLLVAPAASQADVTVEQARDAIARYEAKRDIEAVVGYCHQRSARRVVCWVWEHDVHLQGFGWGDIHLRLHVREFGGRLRVCSPDFE